MPLLNTFDVLQLGELPVKREFFHMQAAMQYIKSVYGPSSSQNFPFKFAIKARADNYVKVDISVSAAYGTTGSFFQHFSKFAMQYDSMLVVRGKQKSTFHEQLWAYVFSGGLVEYIDAMIFNPSPSPWCLVNATSWNSELRDFVFTLPTGDNSNSYNYEGVLKSNMRSIHAKFPIVYLIGSTWVHFGPYEVISTAAEEILKGFGNFKW